MGIFFITLAVLSLVQLGLHYINFRKHQQTVKALRKYKVLITNVRGFDFTDKYLLDEHNPKLTERGEKYRHFHRLGYYKGVEEVLDMLTTKQMKVEQEINHEKTK